MGTKLMQSTQRTEKQRGFSALEKRAKTASQEGILVQHLDVWTLHSHRRSEFSSRFGGKLRRPFFFKRKDSI